MSIDFKQKYGKWALITGATSGIGAEVADQLAASGMNLVLVSRTEAALERYAKKLTDKYKVEVQIIPADLSVVDDLEKVKQTTQQIGLLVLSAGLENNGAFEKIKLEDERLLLQVNVNATMELSHHFGSNMVARGRGGILLVSSLIGHMASPYFTNYSASKAYVVLFGQGLHTEFKNKGVDVSVLSPGLTVTNMTANAGVDWDKLPFAKKQPAEVAAYALDGLGKRVVSIPGKRNKLFGLMAKISPASVMAAMNAMMLKRAIAPERL